MKRIQGCTECWSTVSPSPEHRRGIRPYSFPRRLNSHAISSSIAIVACQRLFQPGQQESNYTGCLHIMQPSRFSFFSSFRKSLIFSWNGFPENLSAWTLTFSFGRAGRSLPQMRSMKFCSTLTNVAPLLLSVSASFLAFAAGGQYNCESHVRS